MGIAEIVRKVLRSDATEFRYERESQPQPRIGPWRDELDRLLTANEAKLSRERLTLIPVFKTLRGLGYAGGYDAVPRCARGWARRQAATTAATYVPLKFSPGEAYQSDWSHDVVLINGVTVKVAHLRLCHSRMLFVPAYPRETQEVVFDAHDRGFAFFKGACTRGIYDNMETAVDAIFVGRERASRPATRAGGSRTGSDRVHCALRRRAHRNLPRAAAPASVRDAPRRAGSLLWTYRHTTPPEGSLMEADPGSRLRAA